jgi:hypothetical protein
MKIRIKDTEKTPMWGMPEVEIHLSMESNDFIPVNYEAFTPYQLQTVWSAIKAKTIEAVDDEEFQLHFKATLKNYMEKRRKLEVSNFQQTFGVEVPQDVQSKNQEAAVAANMVKKANGFRKILGNSIPSLKRVLPDYSALDLELFLKLEENNKNRKTVIKLIHSLISEQVKQNVSKIEAPNAPSAEEYQKRQIFKGGIEKMCESNLGDIIEEEGEEVVEFTVGEE